MTDVSRIRLGISSCLLGEPVRYDGQHKLDRYLRDTLGSYFEYVPVCPEVECGLSVPRESMRLAGDPLCPRLVTSRSGRDLTERMVSWAESRCRELQSAGLCGFIFKSGSPSSGMSRVRVYDEKGMPRKVGTGIFARIFMSHFPLLPVEEEGRLHDMVLRENFIERIFAQRRWRDVLRSERRAGSLVGFHSANKLLIMSHSPSLYRELGRLVAGSGRIPLDELFSRYERGFLRALSLRTTRRKHVNVLQHIMGYFKRDLDSDEKAELGGLIESYRLGNSTLVVPLTLLNHYVRKYGTDYLKSQTYLSPHPAELQLRNHA